MPCQCQEVAGQRLAHGCRLHCNASPKMNRQLEARQCQGQAVALLDVAKDDLCSAGIAGKLSR